MWLVVQVIRNRSSERERVRDRQTGVQRHTGWLEEEEVEEGGSAVAR